MNEFAHHRQLIESMHYNQLTYIVITDIIRLDSDLKI